MVQWLPRREVSTLLCAADRARPEHNCAGADTLKARDLQLLLRAAPRDARQARRALRRQIRQLDEAFRRTGGVDVAERKQAHRETGERDQKAECGPDAQKSRYHQSDCGNERR